MLHKSSSCLRLIRAAVRRFAPHEYHVTRCFKYSVLILMQEGILRFYEDGTLIELHPGEYYIQRAGLLQEGLDKYDEPPHREGKLPVYLYLEFDGGDFVTEGAGVPLRGQYTPQTVIPVARQAAELFDTRCQDPFSMNACLCRVLSELYVTTDRDPAADTLRAVRQYIRSAYFTPLTVRTLAVQFGYHPDHLTRLFRRQFGTTPGQYLKQVRIEQANWLLLHTDRSVEHIAHAVGYHDLSAFYRAYGSICGDPPGACRHAAPAKASDPVG